MGKDPAMLSQAPITLNFNNNSGCGFWPWFIVIVLLLAIIGFIVFKFIL